MRDSQEVGPEQRLIYIADTANHCIRLLTVAQAHVRTVSGVCGTPGNKDGVFTKNLLNWPEVVGID